MKFIAIIITAIFCNHLSAQDSLNKYGLYILNNIGQLQKTIQADSNKSFVRIKDYVPGVVLDIKYATKQNVFYEKLYKRPHAFIRLPAARSLEKVQEELKRHGLGLKIYDGYRPYSVTCRMWDKIPDSIYMGKPWRGSRHNRGIAVDLTLVNLKTGKELLMPTPFDALVYASHPDFMGLHDSVIKNRQILISTMAKYGFSVSAREWWHFDYTPGLDYEILDIPPGQINKLVKNIKRKKQHRLLN